MNSAAARCRPAEREPLPLGRVLRAYLMEAKFETLGALRTPGFALPFLVVPVAIYLLFGVVIAGNAGANSEYGPASTTTSSPASRCSPWPCPASSAASILATEREGNLLQLKRALPLPPGATIVAKVLMSMGVAAIAVTLVAVAALLAGKITLSLGAGGDRLGGADRRHDPVLRHRAAPRRLVSGSAAPAWGNLVFLPMMWLSGLFIPLPESLEKLGGDLADLPPRPAGARPRRRREVHLHPARDGGGGARRRDGALRRPRDPAPGAGGVAARGPDSLLHVDRDLLDVAGELVPVLLVGRAHVGALVHAHVGGVVGGEDVGVGAARCAPSRPSCR